MVWPADGRYRAVRVYHAHAAVPLLRHVADGKVRLGVLRRPVACREQNAVVSQFSVVCAGDIEHGHEDDSADFAVLDAHVIRDRRLPPKVAGHGISQSCFCVISCLLYTLLKYITLLMIMKTDELFCLFQFSNRLRCSRNLRRF